MENGARTLQSGVNTRSAPEMTSRSFLFSSIRKTTDQSTCPASPSQRTVTCSLETQMAVYVSGQKVCAPKLHSPLSFFFFSRGQARKEVCKPLRKLQPWTKLLRNFNFLSICKFHRYIVTSTTQPPLPLISVDYRPVFKTTLSEGEGEE